MGYRSDVKIAFYLQGEDKKVRAPALKLWFAENYPRREAVDEWGATVEYGSDFVLVHYEDVKWYDGYTHPGEVRQAIGRFEETWDCATDGTASWEMVRLGEDPQDIEREGGEYNDYRLDVVRYSKFD